MKKYLGSVTMVALCLFVMSNPRSAYAQEGDINISNPFSQAKFVPDISLIVDFSAVERNMKNEKYESLEVPGLLPAHSHEGDSDANAKNGFNFNCCNFFFCLHYCL